MKAKPILSKWSLYDEDTGKFYIGDPADPDEPRWYFPADGGNITVESSVADTSGDILASVDHSSGLVMNDNAYNDYGTLVTGQEYKAGYFRYNVRSTTPGNPVAEVTGIEGVAASYIADEALTFRGGYFRTYVNADVTSTMRTNIGAEISARASYSGGTECVAESGTAFIGARIWMAPFFTDASITNINNFIALWILNEAAGKKVTHAIKIDAATYQGGFNYSFYADDGKIYNNLDGTTGSSFAAGGSSTASGDTLLHVVGEDYRTLTSSQEYKGAYIRYNVRSTTPSNPTCEVTGVEGVAGSYIADEAITFRGGHFRTYTNADATSTMRTAIGLEASARASYNGGTACVAEAGTAFVGARIWMAPYFSAGSVGNLNNFWGLWIYGEHSSQRNADAAIYISDAGGGFTDIIRLSAAGGADADVNLVKLLVTGTPTIIWDESEDKWGFNKGLIFSAAGALKMGSYASPVDLGSSTVFGFGQFWGSGSGSSDPFIIGQQYFIKTTQKARPFPLAVQAEINNDGTSYPDRGQAGQFIILLGGGGEASKLGALGGDATAGMYAGWFKVGSNVSCSTESGARVAPIWIDSQMNCTVDGEEYAAFITTGGSKPDAVFGFETTSSGWAQLFYFDETAYDQDPVTANSYLKVLLNATQYYIPLSTTDGSFTGTLGAVTLGGTLTAAGGATIASTTAGSGVYIQNTNDGAYGAYLSGAHISATPAANDVLFALNAFGRNSTPATFQYHWITYRLVNATASSEEGKIEWNIATGGALNEAMDLTGAGGLSVDADIGTGDDPVALFDSIPEKYGADDGIFLARCGLNRDSLGKLCDIGVMERKDTGSGYMMSVQKATYLAWGGIAHNRNYLEQTREELLARIEALEKELYGRRN
jgi:hypothetical protein